jgi:hypothetical protein
MARKKTAAPAAPAPVRTARDVLDEVLPVLTPTALEVHADATVMEVEDPAQLLELASDSALRPFLLCRLSATVALVVPGAATLLVDVLRRRGHTPKVLTP